MVVLRSTADSSTGFVNCVSGLGLVCLVVALVGIKLKWFKHRLTFNNSSNNDDDAEIATTSRGFYSANGNGGEGGGGVHRSSSVSSEPQIVRATFRSFDECFEITAPAVLPPIRITNNRPPLRPRSRAPPPPQAVSKIPNEDTFLIEKEPSPDTSESLDVDNEKTAALVLSRDSSNQQTRFHLDEETIGPNQEEHSYKTIDNLTENHIFAKINSVDGVVSTITNHLPTDTISSSHVGSVSVDVLPSNKQTILFTSTENLNETFPCANDPIADSKVRLELPISPIPPNSPPPRPSQLDNYVKYAKLNIEVDESDELTPTASIIPIPFNVPSRQPPTYLPPPPPYSELDKTSESSTPKSIKAKRQVRIVTPELSERSSDSDDSNNAYSIETARTRSTPDLSLPPPNAIRPYLQLTSTSPEPSLSQSTPNLTTASPVRSNPITSLINFLSWRPSTQQEKQPVDALPKKKTKTIRVLKESKQPKVAKLLNPLVQQPPSSKPPTPKPVQRKKKQLKLEASQSNGLSLATETVPSSPVKSVHFAANNKPPVPKQRTILNVNLQTMNEKKPTSAISSSHSKPNGFEMFKANDSNETRLNDTGKSDDSSDEDAWNLVAQHRRNHAELVAKQATVVRKTEIAQPAKIVVDATAVRPLELINRPKTLREMQREKREQASKVREQESDTEA